MPATSLLALYVLGAQYVNISTPLTVNCLAYCVSRTKLIGNGYQLNKQQIEHLWTFYNAISCHSVKSGHFIPLVWARALVQTMAQPLKIKEWN